MGALRWRIFCSGARMRAFACWLLLGFAGSLFAGPQPMANKEIALMLRTGYSSEAVLAEVIQRHVLDPLDEPTKKSLLQFGASAPLITALESKAYLVSSSEAEDAKRHEMEAAGRRAAQIEKDRQYNTMIESRKAEGAAKTANAPA